MGSIVNTLLIEMTRELNEITGYKEPEGNVTLIFPVSRDWVRLIIGIYLPNLSPLCWNTVGTENILNIHTFLFIFSLGLLKSPPPFFLI